MDKPVYTDSENSDVSADTYKKMCFSFYAYRLGMISFLELLDRLEEVLHIRPQQPGVTEVSD